MGIIPQNRIADQSIRDSKVHVVILIVYKLSGAPPLIDHEDEFLRKAVVHKGHVALHHAQQDAD